MAAGEGKPIRTFIAIEIPSRIRDRIGRLQERLRAVDSQASWVKPANIHLTLKFLGDISRDRIESAVSGVERACAKAAPFELEANGCGYFPSTRNPRVLWVGSRCDETNGLLGLHAGIEFELFRAGFAKEKKPFSPHLTIARLRSPRNAREVAEQLQRIGFDPERFTVSEVIVMKSELNPSGSIYTPLAKIALKNDDQQATGST